MREVATLLHVSPKRAYAVLAQGLCPSVKIGGRRHVPRAAWDQWCEAMTARALANVKAVEMEEIPHAG